MKSSLLPANCIAVILLTWNRIENLGTTLDALHSQSCSGFDVFVWNNNYDAKDLVDAILRDSPCAAQVFHSEDNLECIARHRLAASLQQHYSAFIFIDDDQHFRADAIEVLASEYRSNALVGWWAWRLGSEYWLRERAHPGSYATYLGCGMTLIPSSFYNQSFFDLPPEYLRLDDLWCSVYARLNGYELIASRVFVDMQGDDPAALYRSLYPLKEEFCRWTRDRYGYPEISRWIDLKHRVRNLLGPVQRHR